MLLPPAHFTPTPLHTQAHTYIHSKLYYLYYNFPLLIYISCQFYTEHTQQVWLVKVEGMCVWVVPEQGQLVLRVWSSPMKTNPHFAISNKRPKHHPVLQREGEATDTLTQI